MHKKCGVMKGKAKSAAGATFKAGTVGALSAAVSTGVAQAQCKSAATSETSHGTAQALVGSLALFGINAVSNSKASAIAETGEMSSLRFVVLLLCSLASLVQSPLQRLMEKSVRYSKLMGSNLCGSY